MWKRIDRNRLVRWLLSVTLVVTGLSATWAWGQVARLAEPPSVETEVPQPALYAVWRAAGEESARLHRSTDAGASWQPLALPAGAEPVAWTDDGGERLAVAMDDGVLLRSRDRAESWSRMAIELPLLSLAWGGAGDLYLGTDGLGVHHLSEDGTLIPMAPAIGDLASSPVLDLALVEGRLFAATPGALFYTDLPSTGAPSTDGQPSAPWTRSSPLPGRITTLAALDREVLYVGTGTHGVLMTGDAGVSWQAAAEGLGLAPGQMVKITALRADPMEGSVLYAAVDHLLGSTQVHASAAGVFATVDSGGSWQPLAGPAFPEAAHASNLLLLPGQPLYAQAVTAHGLQAYAPDVTGALAALESADPRARAAAAGTLGLARASEAGTALLAALDDPAPAVGLVAADALGRVNDPASVSGLLVALEHPDEGVRLNAARALGLMGVEAAVQPLRTMLLSGTGASVPVAANALGRIGGPPGTEALLVALADPAGTPRWHAAQAALEAMGEPAVGPLAGMLRSENAGARRNAAEALGWIGSPAATAALVEALEDPSTPVREQAAWALGEIGDPAARAALARVQDRDPSVPVQAEATAALARIEASPVTIARWPATWAPALQRLQALRWSLLALSLLGAIWLVASPRTLQAVPALQRNRRR